MTDILPGFDNKGWRLSAIEYQVLSGNVFGSQAFDESLANDANLDMLLRTGEFSVAARIRGFAGGDGLGDIFQAPVITADGTPLITTNRNLVKAIAKGPAKSLLFSGPTLTSPGTPLSEQFFIPGGTGGNSTGGASVEILVVLEPMTEYVLRLTNKSGVASPFQLSLAFVEGKMSDKASETTRDVVI